MTAPLCPPSRGKWKLFNAIPLTFMNPFWNMMRNLFTLRGLGGFISLLMLVGTLTSCDVHQWPESAQNPPGPNPPDNPDDPNEPDDPATKGLLTLKLKYNPELYVWEHLYEPKMGSIKEQYPDANLYPGYPATTDMYSNILDGSIMEINVRVTDSNSKQVAYKTFYKEADDNGYDQEVNLELTKGKNYTVTAWSQLLKSEDSLPFYDASDFYSIKLVKDSYVGNTDYRDGYRGKTTVNLPEEGDATVEMDMKRPMAKFEFVSTDLSEFLEIEAKRRGIARPSTEDYTVVIVYPAYYPDAYSANDDRLENSAGGYSFATDITITGDNEASLGFDYVLINNVSDAGVQAQLIVFDNKGTQVAASGMLTIPLRRDHHTVLRGYFLTANGGGGIGIDPGFDGDHNITIQ